MEYPECYSHAQPEAQQALRDYLNDKISEGDLIRLAATIL